MVKIYRNKRCKECPQNKREDVVWNKGLQDGIQIGLNMVIALIDKKLKNKQ